MKKILVVDDSATEVLKLTGILKRHGFVVLSAASAATAVSMAREFKPELILMDVVMPGVSGFQATRELNSDPETREIPVVMLTAKDQPSDRIWGERQGARGYLTKPVTEKSLIDAISPFLG